MCRLQHGIGSNNIQCNGCTHWVHKKCSGLKRLKKDLNYRCSRCQRTARPIDRRPQKEVQAGSDKLEVVASFYYLGTCSLLLVDVNLQQLHVSKPPGRSSRSCCLFSHPTTSPTRPEVLCTAHVSGMRCFMQARLGP